MMNLGRAIRGLSVCCSFLVASSLDAAPHIVFKPFTTPYPTRGYPTAPFPSDDFTTPDPTTLTGLRVNLSAYGQGEFEKKIRTKLNELNGFGTYSPILIPFDSPLDLKTVNARSIFLINLKKNSPSYGKGVPIDYGSGVYEYKRKGPDAYFPNDPLYHLDNFLFSENNRTVFYEDKTDTLILRPLSPLEEETRYGVILTTQLKGMDGEPIKSHRKPSDKLLKEIESLIPPPPTDKNEIVYAWEFTTQSIASDLKLVREGLYGRGACAFLGLRFPAVIQEISDLKTRPFNIDQNSFILTPVVFQKIIVTVANLIKRLGMVDPFDFEKLLNWNHVDYFVFGNYLSPQFNKNASDSFQMDTTTGITPYQFGSVYFMLAVPKKGPKRSPPFPVAIFGHGNKRSRIDTIGLSNRLAEGGIATLTIDADQHGPEKVMAALPVYIKRFLSNIGVQSAKDVEAVKKDLKNLGQWVGVEEKDIQNEARPDEAFSDLLIDKIFNQGILRVLTREGRATDVDDDGIVDSGEAFFSADLFQTRDIIRQTIIDSYQLVRVLKQLGIDHNNNGKLDLMEGDFNRDGLLDIGGPQNPIHYVGMSMGGILGGILLATEPEIQTGVLNVGGGGLVDIVLKSSSKFNVKRIFHQLWGPAISGVGLWGKTYLILNGGNPRESFTTIQGLDENSYVFLRNKTTDVSSLTRVNKEQGFLVNVPADRGDILELSALTPSRKLIAHETFQVAYQEGLGYQRNTPEFLRFASLAQWVIDPGDPINYARHLKNKNVLIQLALGDWTVPIATGINLARTSDLISPERLSWLLTHNVHLGEIIPVDTPPHPPESTEGAAVRFHPSGKHEYLIIPNVENKEKMAYTDVSQEQVLRYLLSNGKNID